MPAIDSTGTYHRLMAGCFTPDDWLAEALGCPAFKLTPSQGTRNRGQLAAEMNACAGGADAFFYAKVTTRNVAECVTLSSAGFSVIDTGITFAWTGSDRTAASNAEIQLASQQHHEAAADIAERCFQWSRFHLDPRIAPSIANKIKRRWIENYCRGGRGSALYVGLVRNVVAGFLAVLEGHVDKRPTAVIDLIGVAPGFQGHGIGTALVRRFIHEWQHRSSELRVGTQAANIQSLRFYERNGFRIVASDYVLHAHYRDGGLAR